MKFNIRNLANQFVFWLILAITFTSVFPLYHHYEFPQKFKHYYSIDPDIDSLYKEQLTADPTYQKIKQKIDSINKLTAVNSLPSNGGFSLIEVLGIESTYTCDSCDDNHSPNISQKKT
ncbi:MAG: hypothetical protein KGO92_11685, partial [Bacteroidota bacterium]|nr:hypothetical protein [Bacteroidota bacterium]